jgi:hypothetical protein
MGKTEKTVSLITFFESTETDSGGRKKVAENLRIIPGDRGKVEPGWLAQPL